MRWLLWTLDATYGEEWVGGVYCARVTFSRWRLAVVWPVWLAFAVLYGMLGMRDAA